VRTTALELGAEAGQCRGKGTTQIQIATAKAALPPITRV
jgi:hypothetical protein